MRSDAAGESCCSIQTTMIPVIDLKCPYYVQQLQNPSSIHLNYTDPIIFQAMIGECYNIASSVTLLISLVSILIGC